MSTILKQLYKALDFENGELLPAMETPNSITQKAWLEKGEWLASAKRAGADSIFFVENNPVVVFAECAEDSIEKIRKFNRIWSLSRPRLLFLSSPDELTIYDLAQEPVDLSKKGDDRKKLNTLEILKNINLIAEKLQDFHRDNIESGKVFEQHRFGDLKNRADKALIRDLKIVRRELIGKGLSGNNAHALISRSIFIRYLEDRGVLTEEYFDKVARKKAGWKDILKEQTNYTVYDFAERKSLYAQVLSNKEFTYALFRSLATDFNGDIFPDVDQEEKAVKQEHLNLLQGLLYGNTGLLQLFFYSYKFDIIPLDLISSIYEEFYHLSANNGKARQNGAFYTPSVLVEFVLSRILTEKELQKNPRVLDPACGSGIFLVEAFRRMVRYQRAKKNKALTFDELKKILKNQIAGIEIEQEAARITAFSLCISMLHYLEPPSIQEHIKQGNKLPNLIASERHSQNHYQCIFVGNAFNESAIAVNPLWIKRFGNECVDVIVGNPPWGKISDKNNKEDILKWCSKYNKTIGDKEPSQAFILRALNFLKKGGKAGMLVSAGVLFKHGPKSQLFRKDWLSNVELREVFNFTHVRKFFFKEAISPFVSIYFEKGEQGDCSVLYASAKQTIILDKTQAILFSKYDFNWIKKQDLSSSKMWKTYWFGRYIDDQFLKSLSSLPQLSNLIIRNKTGRGYQLGVKDKTAECLKNFNALDITVFSRYEKLFFIKPPEYVERYGILEAYSGQRLIVKKGILDKVKDKGQIVARYEEAPFCFTNSISGLKLKSPEEWKYKTILGILWSSFARYYFFMTASNWGLWHYEIHLEDELLQIPIVLDKTSPATKKIISIVNELRNYHPQKQDILYPNGIQEDKIEAKRRKWEIELDEAVFELYGLNDEQKDLIRDCCEVTLPFFYKPFKSDGTQPVIQNNDLSWIERYSHIFARRWNAYLDDNKEMRAKVHIGHGNMLAIEFYSADKESKWNLKPDIESWKSILAQTGKSLPQPMGTSQIILDGLVYVVSKSGIIIIKRNEKRFWTRSLAREDADATIAKAMAIGMEQKENR